jgi:hypothetical protein
MFPQPQYPCYPLPVSSGFVTSRKPILVVSVGRACGPVRLVAGGCGGGALLTSENAVPWFAPCPPASCPPSPGACPGPSSDPLAQLVPALIAALQSGGKGQCGCGGLNQQLQQLSQQISALCQQQCVPGFAPPPPPPGWQGVQYVSPGYAPAQVGYLGY